MNDELLFERLASHEEPVSMDRAFENRLYAILEREMRRGRSLRPALLLAATLVLVLTITAAIAFGSGLIKPPWVHPSLVPTPMANGLIAYPLGEGSDFLAPVADIYVTSVGAMPRRIIGSPEDGLFQTCPAFSPDGALLAYGESAENSDRPVGAAVVIVALDTNGTPSPRLRVDVPAGRHPCPKWSPDGRAVAYLAGDAAELWVAPLAGSPTSYGRLPCEPGIGCATGFAWTRDSSALVLAHSEALRLVPVDGTEAPRILTHAAVDGDLSEFFEGISASPAAGLVAVGGGLIRWKADGSGSQESGFVRVVDMDSGHVMWEQDWEGGSIDPPVWSPVGTRIAWALPDGLLPSGLFVHAIDDASPDARANQWAVEGRPSVTMASGVVWSPDGKRLLFVGHTKTPPAYAIVSIAVDGPPDLRVLTPWTMGLYNAGVADLSWQAVDP